jgi:three-Cys-motif partner protein
MNDPNELYQGREQTFVKHFMLREYLEKFAYKVGSTFKSITYIDCFSGPWNAHSKDFKDCSFAIALGELRKAREALTQRGNELEIRCFFLEEDREAYSKLKAYADSASDPVTEIVPKNGQFENSIDDILGFIRKKRNSFPFIFIDPTGWTGFGMLVIEPLLKLDPSEVLINFMTGHAIRFAESEDPKTKESFDELYGDPNFRTRLKGLQKQDREDEIIRKYMENVKSAGKFKYVLCAMILQPQKDRTHFHLIYATRNTEGVAVFKDAEKKAMKAMEIARADAQQRERESQFGQMELFGSDDQSESRRYIELRDRYLEKAKQIVESELKRSKRVLYDHIWILALEPFPLVWESDLKGWIADWLKTGSLKVENWKPKQRVPHRDESNFLVWRET